MHSSLAPLACRYSDDKVGAFLAPRPYDAPTTSPPPKVALAKDSPGSGDDDGGDFARAATPASIYSAPRPLTPLARSATIVQVVAEAGGPD